ncbi:MAG TPA: hypothetical protein VF920_16555 [Dongiaceae bacterium]
MKTLRYPLSALLGDYARGILGSTICLVIVITYDWTNRLIWLFIALTALFLVYTIRTAIKQKTIIQVDDGGITSTLFGSKRRIDWDRLKALSLRYYAPRRAKKKGLGSVLGRLGGRGYDDKQAGDNQPKSPFADGWMELVLRDQDHHRIVIDSALPQFLTLTNRAVSAARQNGLEIDAVTDDNLRVLADLPDDLLKAVDAPRSNAPQASGPNSQTGA